MANTKSAKQEILVNKRNRLRNTHYKSMLKTFYKKAIIAIESKDKNVVSTIRHTLKLIDKVASKNIIHKRYAARKKSILAKNLNSIQK